MKIRIISALVGLIILGVAIAFYDTIIFNLFITALAVIGIYEGHHAASLTKNTGVLRFTVCCLLFLFCLFRMAEATSCQPYMHWSYWYLHIFWNTIRCSPSEKVLTPF